MQKAMQLLIKTVPVLSRAYRNYDGKSYWEDTGETEWADLFSIVTDKVKFDEFAFSRTNEATGPQIKACLLQAESDSLLVIINHMVSDAAGFKQCIYLLAEIYSQLVKDPDYLPDFMIDGNRSFKSIVDKVGFLSGIKLFISDYNDNNQKRDCEFPFDKGGETLPFYITYEVPPENYHMIKKVCRENNATVNDALLAAYIRVLSRMLDMTGENVSVTFAVDMRRYLQDKSFYALTNLSSNSSLSIAVLPGENFRETLCKVSVQMNEKKSCNMGMNTFLKLNALFKLMYSSGYKILDKVLHNPKIGITNIGVLESSKLAFGNSPVMNAFMYPSMKYRPHFQVASTTFNDIMTLSVNLFGSPKDRETMNRFFELMDDELKNI
jgi:NRPS condensation-like uncharacterized protein